MFLKTEYIQIVSLRDNQLMSLNGQVFREDGVMVELSFAENNLQSIPKNMLWKIFKLAALDLSDNNISSIPEDLFHNVCMLVQLDISNNRIREIPNRLFDLNEEPHELIFLFLNYNLLTFLQKGVFLGLPNLQILSLFGNRIAQICPDVFAIDSLEEVHLFNNSLLEFSHNWLGTNSSAELHVYGNEIATIFGNVTRSMRMNGTLYLNCNYLKKIWKHSMKLSCVSPMFSPDIRVGPFEDDVQIMKFFQLEGFTCYRIPSNEFIYCKACQRGTYSNGKNECAKCPRGGFFQDEIGARTVAEDNIKCKKCPNGTYVEKGAGLSKTECTLCPDGTMENVHAGFRACFCKDGFSRRDRFAGCEKCSQKGLLCTGQDFQSLRGGYFWNWSFPNASIRQYDAFAANLRNETESYNNNTFYFMEIPRVHKCLRPRRCINNYADNSTTSVDSACSAGHTGWLCSKCQYGYYPLLSMCLSCPENIITALEVIGTFCLCVGLTVFIWWQYKKPHNTNIKKGAVNIIVARIKILLGFYQVLAQLLFTNQGGETFTIVEQVISFFEVNVIRMSFRLKCLNENFTINPKFEFVFAALLIFLFTAVPLLYFLTKTTYMKISHQRGNTHERLKAMKDKVLTIAVLMLFVTYPSICSSIFQLYPMGCVRFCLDLSNRHCFTVLRSDMDVPCDSKLRYYQVFAIALTIAYVFTFPLVLLFLLRKYYSTSSDSEKERNNVRKTFKISVRLPLPVWAKFLCENYKNGFWYWEIIELARKVVQTVLIFLFGWEDEVSVLITIGTSVIFLTLHAKYMPMKCNQEQWLQVVFSLCIILINVLFIGVRIPHEYNDTTWWALAVLNSSLVLITIVEIFIRLLFRLRHAELYWKFTSLLLRRSDKAEYRSTNH
ncbi:Leucine-rich repeat-containing protein 15 [Holothuria leucospilota]|uniref:Leucine-rich repeat-containing protein 15 n=1 Tax=Holothuria leucospilota TaxID=206669 RepID=A0A9Q1HAF4_HOLLE|nr:Leucine-rich repeat-containing protein 15 [Holothuria leucospilota]